MWILLKIDNSRSNFTKMSSTRVCQNFSPWSNTKLTQSCHLASFVLIFCHPVSSKFTTWHLLNLRGNYYNVLWGWFNHSHLELQKSLQIVEITHKKLKTEAVASFFRTCCDNLCKSSQSSNPWKSLLFRKVIAVILRRRYNRLL